MKTISFNLILLLVLTLFFSCKKKVEVQDDPVIQIDLDTSQEVKDNQEIDSLLSELDEEDENRQYWQKPDLVIDLLGKIEGKTIADIGAGTGFFTFPMAFRNAKVLALEIDQEAINWLNGVKQTLRSDIQENIDVRLISPTDPSLQDGEVDIILIVNVIAYIENRVDYLRKAKKAIKPDGKICIVDYKMKKLDIEAPGLDTRVPLYRIEQDLEAAGFKIISSDDRNLEYQYIVQAGN